MKIAKAIQLSLCGAMLLGIWDAAYAQEAPETSETAIEQWESLSVRQLMQQDLQQALDAADKSAAGRGGSDPAAPVVRAVLAPKLVALYGVGAVLMAEVQVGQQAYLYIRGQTFPAGYAGDAGVYQLRGINGACVQLERGEDRHSLCLRMLLGEGQP